MTAPTDADLQGFVDKVQILRAAHYVDNRRANPTTTFTRGPKYARIVESTWGGQSVYCFVDLANGDILKSESWKKPAKHARGNIFNENALKGCTAYGAEYLR